MTDALFRAGRDAAKAGSTHHAMHRFRLTIKRVRYTLELFAHLYGAEAAAIMDPLKGLQEKLGAINDCAATLVMVQHNPAAAAAVRGLAEKRESEFRKYWKLHFEPRTRVQWKSALAGKEKELDGNLHSEAR
jgi:CHAD domain-containing protein